MLMEFCMIDGQCSLEIHAEPICNLIVVGCIYKISLDREARTNVFFLREQGPVEHIHLSNSGHQACLVYHTIQHV